jgi:hypothetical protein
MWDAYGKGSQAPPSNRSLGNFTCLPGQQKTQFVVGDKDVYFIGQWTVSGVRGVFFENNPVSIDTTPASASPGITLGLVNIPQITSGSIPLAVRPLRQSYYLTNGNKWPEGFVDVLCLPDPLSWTFQNPNGARQNKPDGSPDPDGEFVHAVSEQWVEALDSLIDGNPKTRTYKASKFDIAKRFVLGPASDVGYHAYENWPDTPNQWPEVYLIEGAKQLAMTTLLMRFNKIEPPQDGQVLPLNVQKYTIHTYTQDAIRYPANSALGGMAKPQPSNPVHSKNFKNAGKNVSQTGSMAHTLAAAGAGSAATVTAQQLASYVAPRGAAAAAGGAEAGMAGMDLIEMGEILAPLLVL